ncbi:hypothetical protein [Helicobacter mustelae]|uniref:JHP0747 family n=1 Tax=Helicobacter mustelae (strain ATCC 43772 / CCUG 25715 / CIP 103759 / LMG 18044 / NCTC 12198 / R85-136P) TaxID=679897 RepID=D3UIN2_HELM1|nr:hypothetical protein [Helicobacter mustelae]CBG40357.1 Putative hypothetical protein [Helicobacter mustelae 12198]SQH71856.1 Dihydroneopterin aldolase [Helicobacter mustelae]STP12995.1 Dihydroneopterin aldolase [Helicobacter mustelae]
MKICIMCESTLLQSALEYYLQEYLCPYQEAEFIISDISLNIQKPICFIQNDSNTHIKKPFTPVSLFRNLQEFYHSEIKKTTIDANAIIPAELLNIKDPQLQTKINSILQEFSKKIYQTLNTNPQNEKTTEKK